MTRLEVYVAHLDCEHEAAAIQRGLAEVPGITAVNVFAKAGKVAFDFDPTQITASQLTARLDALGFPVQQAQQPAAPPRPWRNPKVVTSVLSGILLFVGWLAGLAGAPPTLLFVIFLAAIGIGGYYFGREALEKLVHERKISIEFLMATAAVVATVMGQALEGAMLIFLYSISEAMEGYTEEKTRSAIRALMALVPKRALVLRDGQEVDLPVEEVRVGDIFLVKPGEAIATDGDILAGATSVNQAPVTGESLPVEKHGGDPVFAGSINGEGALQVRATKTAAENTIARMIHLVEEAQEKKGKSQRFIERFGAWYSPLVLLLGILIAIIPPLAFQAPWETWVIRATVFIVAAAPCALVISIPITLVATLGTGARQGVLIKGGVFIEELARVTVVALDKTGTLTHGEPEVSAVIPVDGVKSRQEILALAAGIERWSEHPLARAIVRTASAEQITPVETQAFQALPGAGARAQAGQVTYFIGKPDWFRQEFAGSRDVLQTDIARLQADGNTVVLVGDGVSIWGLIAMRDTVRPQARAAVAALHAAGIKHVVMLTGDNLPTAQAIAREVGIDQVYANLTPEEKVRKVQELTERAGHVAMVGDGVNDAPALAAATVGVAMGAAGTDVALETADVALMADDLEKLAYALHLAHRNQSVVRQNLVLSTVVISVLVVGAVAGVFSLPIAVLGHEISEFIVIGSGLRMLRA